MTGRDPQRRAFSAMGTIVEMLVWGVGVVDVDEIASAVQSRAESWEGRFSRFRPESEICRVNASSGAAISVTPEFLELVRKVKDGYVATAGRFDPTIIDALERAGYDRTFQLICRDRPNSPSRIGASRVSPPSLLDIDIDESDGTVTLPPGLRLDFGGIAKGAFVDSVASELIGLPGAILNAGGDIGVFGFPGDSREWRIGVQHPGKLDSDVTQILLNGGGRLAVATSSTRTRTWVMGSERLNHLIDPMSLAPVPWSTPSVSVVARSATQAEIESKSILVALARGHPIPDSSADLVVIAWEDGRHEAFRPYSTAA